MEQSRQQNIGPYLSEVRVAQLKRRTNPETKKRSDSVRVKLVKKDAKNLRWIFQCWSDGEKYKVTIKADGKGTLAKLNAKVSCHCPAFLFWGSDYWASIGGYLDKHNPGYRSPRSHGKAPEIRDPDKNHILCKHVVAAYNEWKNVRFP